MLRMDVWQVVLLFYLGIRKLLSLLIFDQSIQQLFPLKIDSKLGIFVINYKQIKSNKTYTFWKYLQTIHARKFLFSFDFDHCLFPHELNRLLHAEILFLFDKMSYCSLLI